MKGKGDDKWGILVLEKIEKDHTGGEEEFFSLFVWNGNRESLRRGYLWSKKMVVRLF